MRILFLSLFLAFSAPAAQANITSWLFGSKEGAVDCAPTDRDCLWNAAADMVFARIANLEVPQNTDTAARQLADLVQLGAPSGAEDMRARVAAAKADPSFLKNFDYRSEQRVADPLIDLETLTAVLNGAAPPEGMTYGDVAFFGFSYGLNGETPDVFLDLWWEHFRALWKDAGRSYHQTLLWMAENDLDAFEIYDRDFILRSRAKQGTWADFAALSDLQCRDGRTDDGRRVLTAVLGQFSRYDWKDPVIKLYAKAELFTAVLACRGETAAQDFMADIDALRRPATDFVLEKYTNAKERAFVMSAVHDTVELRTHRVLAVHYYVAGDKTRAREVFEAGGATQSVWDFTPSDQDKLGLTSIGRESIPFETFESDIEVIQVYSVNPSDALTFLLNDYRPTQYTDYRADGYQVAQRLEQLGNQLAEAWPSELSQQSAARLLEIAQETAASDPDRNYLPFRTMLRAAALPQPARCVLPQDVLQTELDRLPDYQFGDTRIETLLALLRYLDREGAQSGPCALEMMEG